ncbi:hypothetical protein ScPMuIL_004083 [Solemya velum]
MAARRPVQRVDPEVMEMCRPKRTEANPKHSLFGTSFEIHDEDERESIRKMDVKSCVSNVTSKDRYVLPDSMKSKLPGKDVYERAKEEFRRQQVEADTTRSDLDKAEKKAFMFGSQNTRPIRNVHGDRIQSERSLRWMSEKDLDHAKEMNRVGLNERGSYNRDKYGRRPPLLKYSPMGDALNQEKSSFEKMNQRGATRRDLIGNSVSPGQGNRDTTLKLDDDTVIHVPQNIRHQFGSHICDALLSDKEKVQAILMRQGMKRSSRRSTSAADGMRPQEDLYSEYETLGNAMRQNIFPGFTSDAKQSCTKSEFTDTVHLHRYPDPDQYRYKKDELSRWAEHNVIRERMKKAWNQSHETKGAPQKAQ